MSPATPHDPVEVLAETPHLRFVRRGRWTFVQRQGAGGVVCVVAVTASRELVLVEQYRPPVDRAVIELPAGLAGDQASFAHESLEEAARRELLEETGYVAEHLQLIAEGLSSAGLTDEYVAMFLAPSAARQSAGGGDDTETITVHTIPLDQVEAWLRQQQAAGKLVDLRVYLGLHYAMDRRD